MKSKWAILTKVQLQGLLGFNKAKYSRDQKVKRKTVGIALVYAMVAVLLLFYIVMMAVMFCKQGLGGLLPATTVALVSLITFVFTLIRGCTGLFALKDYDQVMSLPVKKSDLVISRILCVYLSNLVFALGVTIPCLIVLFAMSGFSAAALFVTLSAAIVAPAVPMAIGVLISTLVSALLARLPFKNILHTVLQIAIFVGLMVLSFPFSFNSSASQEMDMNALYDVIVGRTYPPALLINMALRGQVWAIFAFIGGSVLVAAAFVAVMSVLYERIHNALNARAAKKAYNAKHIRSGTAYAALVRREFKRLFSSPTYLMNGLAGGILILLAGAALLIFDAKNALLGLGLPPSILPQFIYGGMGLLVMFVGMSCPAASALSLEGKSRDQLFTMPISARNILLAKALPTFTVNSIVGVAGACILCGALGADPAAWIILPLTTLLTAAFAALSGIFLNVKFPKYDWNSETQVIKQSAPVMLMTLGSMFIGLGVAALGFFFGFWVAVALDALMLCLTLSLLFYFNIVKLYV